MCGTIVAPSPHKAKRHTHEFKTWVVDYTATRDGGLYTHKNDKTELWWGGVGVKERFERNRMSVRQSLDSISGIFVHSVEFRLVTC